MQTPIKRGLVPAALAALAALALAAPASHSAAGGGGGPRTCKHAADPANQVAVASLRKAVACLINNERRRHGRRLLRHNKDLTEAARRHTATMVKTNCLAHRCPNEPDLPTRIERTGYLQGFDHWRFAENTGCALTAEAMVANWMGSKFHRINIVNGKFRDLGVGASHKRVEGRCKRGYGTFTAVFGFRRR